MSWILVAFLDFRICFADFLGPNYFFEICLDKRKRWKHSFDFWYFSFFRQELVDFAAGVYKYYMPFHENCSISDNITDHYYFFYVGHKSQDLPPFVLHLIHQLHHRDSYKYNDFPQQNRALIRMSCPWHFWTFVNLDFFWHHYSIDFDRNLNFDFPLCFDIIPYFQS